MSHRVPAGLEATPGFLALFERHGPGYRWWATGIGMLGSFATLLSSTIVNVAIPDVMGALGMGRDEAQWLATAFLASGTVTMLVSAWCLGAFGIARTWNSAMVVFIAGSALGGVAASSEILLLSRVVQGMAAGIITPIGMVVTAQVFPVHQRGLAMGLMGVGTILAPALGPTMGGWLVDHLSWRWVFFAPAPFAALSIPLAGALFPARETTGPRRPFDWLGTLLCSVFIAGLLIGFTSAQRHGWNHDPAILAVAAGLVGLVAWILWERLVEDPILEMRLFLEPRFVAAAVVTFTVGIGLYGSTYVFPLFLQGVSRLIATETGLLMAPAGLAMAALFPLAGRLADLTSHRAMILGGLVLFAASNLPMTGADAFTPAGRLLAWYVLGRIGLAMIFPSLNAAAINPLPLALIPHGSGAINFLRQLGGAFGINLITMRLDTQLAAHADAVAATQQWDNAATRELMRRVIEELAQVGVVGYRAFETSFLWVLATIDGQALMLAYRDAFAFIGLVFVATLLPALFIAGRRPGA